MQSYRGPLALNVPRAREGSFTPLVVPPHSRVLAGVEHQVLALYTVGMSTLDISEQLAHLSTFFAYPECIRRVIHTTNAVEAVHWQMRKVTKTKGAFPSEEVALKQLFLNLRLDEKNVGDLSSVLAGCSQLSDGQTS